ncbi:glycoside hydrolase family 2 TIM barrel-domain containing protein [uncultured Microbacterium sp.]|uniref:glycoside hydrolase family 2 TIM barrel-domain containing protein n=1 Tax=uncultured Microbacterium sp. TaxID=191216 RepID=UPI0026017DB7|nr:glycoside hydrolase family 2 TIM barrel-domain containing protein [uncultured Microbacterium sp.]
MIRTSLHDGWTIARKLAAFESRDGVPAPAAVAVPHDALRDLPRSPDNDGGVHSGYIPGGVFEYARDLEVPAEWAEKTVLLEFEGVYRDAVVYINGAFAAHEPNGYAAFTVAADAFLRFGETNTITVEARAHRDSRWYTGAGIYRPVHLVVGDPVHLALEGTTVVANDIDPERAIVEIATRVENTTRHTRTVRLAWQIVAPDGTVVAEADSPVTVLPGGEATARVRLPVAEPALWGPDSPVRYEARMTLRDGDAVIDEDAAAFGIRRLQLDGVHGLRVNGQTVDLRGACVHHDNGPLGAITHPDAEDRKVRLLKEGGFNAIRSAHNPASRALLEACDRHGVLVMDELSDVWTRAKTVFDASVGFDKKWENDVAALVLKDRNHPSVVLYSIGNEILELGTPHGATWSRRIAEEFRRLDPTRFITNGINGILANMDKMAEVLGDLAEADPNTMMAGMGEQMAASNASELVTRSTEESAAVLDVVGFNYADSRYELDGELFPNRIIVGSETFPDRIADLWRDVQRFPYVIGDFTWTGFDYIGEAGIGRVEYTDVEGYRSTGTAGPFPYLLAQCGDIDITGYRTPASLYREIAFGLSAGPAFAVHRPEHHGRPVEKTPWSWDDAVASWSWGAEPGSPVTVDVYAAADEVELLLDGRSLGVATVGAPRPLIARFETEYQPGELVAIARRGGAEVGRSALRTAGEVALRAVAEASTVDAAAGLAYLPITLTDAAGIAVCDRDVEVTVAVSGPGELAGLGSGRARTLESFAGPTRRTHDGRLLAIVRATASGTITLTATAEGYAPAVVEVRAG